MLIKSVFQGKENRPLVGEQSRYRWLGYLLPVLVVGGCWGQRTWQYYVSPPQAIIVLGGDEAREEQAATLAAHHPQLPVWISSGSPESHIYQTFQASGVPRQRLRLSYKAKDTVTNFTTLVDTLAQNKIRSVYLVTSENHMARAQFVGRIIFGSRGIVMRPIAVKTEAETESSDKYLRDSLRAFLWLTTGRTGETLVHGKTFSWPEASPSPPSR
ncbi:MAG: YdcF family protein [Synechocystis sp.]|nr:YdcF family protein [Synechocystis sp.]